MREKEAADHHTYLATQHFNNGLVQALKANEKASFHHYMANKELNSSVSQLMSAAIKTLGEKQAISHNSSQEALEYPQKAIEYPQQRAIEFEMFDTPITFEAYDTHTSQNLEPPPNNFSYEQSYEMFDYNGSCSNDFNKNNTLDYNNNNQHQNQYDFDFTDLEILLAEDTTTTTTTTSTTVLARSNGPDVVSNVTTDSLPPPPPISLEDLSNMPIQFLDIEPPHPPPAPPLPPDSSNNGESLDDLVRNLELTTVEFEHNEFLNATEYRDGITENKVLEDEYSEIEQMNDTDGEVMLTFKVANNCLVPATPKPTISEDDCDEIDMDVENENEKVQAIGLLELINSKPSQKPLLKDEDAYSAVVSNVTVKTKQLWNLAVTAPGENEPTLIRLPPKFIFFDVSDKRCYMDVFGDGSHIRASKILNQRTYYTSVSEYIVTKSNKVSEHIIIYSTTEDVIFEVKKSPFFPSEEKFTIKKSTKEKSYYFLISRPLLQYFEFKTNYEDASITMKGTNQVPMGCEVTLYHYYDFKNLKGSMSFWMNPGRMSTLMMILMAKKMGKKFSDKIPNQGSVIPKMKFCEEICNSVRKTFGKVRASKKYFTLVNE